MRRLVIVAVAVCVALVAVRIHAQPKQAFEQRLIGLQKKRVETATELYRTVKLAFDAETVSDRDLLDAACKVRDAKLAMAITAAAKIDVLKSHLELAKEIERVTNPPQMMPESRYSYYSQYERQSAEIALLEAQASRE